MSYTLSDIRNQVIDDKLDDTSFDPNVVDRFINATQRDIFNTYELPFMEKIDSQTLSAGEHVFLYPTDLQVLQSAVITDPNGKQRDITRNYLPYKEFNQRFPTPANNTAGAIFYWTSYAGVMYTSAPTDVAYTLELFYLKKAVTLEDDADIPSIPEEFQELLVLGAFKRILQRNEDYDMGAAVANEYNDQLDKLVNRYGFRITGGPVIMKQPNRYPTRRI